MDAEEGLGTLTPMPGQTGGNRTVSFIFTDEVIELPYAGNRIETGRIVNGGLPETVEILCWLAGMTGQGMIGNIAWDAVKLGYRNLRLRLAWGKDEDKRAYVSYVAQLAVAAKFSQPTDTRVVACQRQRDYWETVVIADGKTFRVQIPPDDPRPSALSVDIE